jgi:hypothetical protein
MAANAEGLGLIVTELHEAHKKVAQRCPEHYFYPAYE